MAQVKSPQYNYASRVDLCATGLSVLCILHCLGLPLASIFFVASAQACEDHLLHVAMVMLATPLTLYVVWREFRAHADKVFVGSALFGLSLLILAVSLHVTEHIETVLTVLGGATLGAAHLWRYFSHRRLAAAEQGCGQNDSC